MKVYCLVKYQDAELVRHGGVYAVERNLSKALAKMQGNIDLDFQAGCITSHPKLELDESAGLRRWRAVAWSTIKEFQTRYIYSVEEFEMKMR